MFRKLYEQIEDTGAYLTRIGWKGPVKIDRATLDGLILAHQLSIPFENLDISVLKREISLEIAHLYEKIVVRRRGGYCFELNALFSMLLRQLGFTAYSCLCRITRGKDYTPPSLHQAIIVTLEDRRVFCDVGFGGPMPAGSVSIEDEFVQNVEGEYFIIQKYDDYWFTLIRETAKGLESLLQFTVMPQEPVDFLGPNEYCSKNPNSYFLGRRLVNIRTERGSKSITDDLFCHIEEGVRTEKNLQTFNEYRQVLKEDFDILLDI